MPVVSITDLENAELDITTLSDVVNNASGTVTNRNSDVLDTIAKILADGEAELLNIMLYDTKALLDADLVPGSGRIAIVTSDTTTSNNGVYRKSGATGTGSWILIEISGTTGAGASLDLSDKLTIKGVNVLNTIDEVKRTGIVPTVDINAIPEEGVPQGCTFSRASTATRLSRMGIIETMDANTIRHDYDPETGAYRGWLLEENSTNLILQSEDFNTTWSDIRSNVTTNAVKAPDGETTADKIVEDTTASATHNVQQAFSATSGTYYTFSCFVKDAGDGRDAELRAFNTAFDTTGALFNFSTETMSVGTGTPDNYGFVKYPNGWYRIWMSVTAVATGNGSAALYLHNGSTTSYTGDGSSGIYAWGYQVEAQRDGMSSYIKTTTSQVTRSEDIFELANNAYSPNDWYNKDEGTLYVNMKFLTRRTTEYIVSLKEDGSNYISMRGNSADTGMVFRVREDGTNLMDDTISLTKSNFNKYAIAYESGRQQTIANGTLGSERTLTPDFPENADLEIGQLTSVSEMQGWIKRICYFPRALTNAQLQQLTG
jgi:hypothetical protein